MCLGKNIDYSKENILVIDDEPMICDVVTKYIEREGLFGEVVGITDPAVALEYLYNFSIVISDINMPEMSGSDFLIKALEMKPEIIVIIISGYGTIDSCRGALTVGAYDFIQKPVNRNDLISAIKDSIKKRDFLLNLKSDNSLLKTKLKTTINELKRTQKEIINRLTVVAEFRDLETGQHLNRMHDFSKIICDKVPVPSLSAIDKELIPVATVMHDIGKISIPDAILLKPGKLTDDEWEIMKTHTTNGKKMLQNSDIGLLNISEIIAHEHHERFDGKGYPRGISGKDIYIGARICSIADIFDALISERPYKQAYKVKEAYNILSSLSGSNLDPELLKYFLDSKDEIEESIINHSSEFDQHDILR